MLPGVYLATKKDGTVYYRSSITYRSKHISLGSFPTEEDAHCAYRCALKISSEPLSLEESLAFTNYRMGYASALAWILFLIILIFTILRFVLKKDESM